MKYLKLILIITLVSQTITAQNIDESGKNIIGFNRIITGNGDWMDIQLAGSGSSFKIHDNTNGGNWVKWTAGSSYTEFLKEIRLNANITAVGSRNIYGFNRIQTPNGGWMDIQLAGSGSSFKIHDNTNGGNWVKWTAGSNYTEFLKDVIVTSGKVGIGTSNPDMKLTVNGNIHAKEVKIDLNIPAPDYVFKDNYDLKTIEEVEIFIKENNHLPEIPSAKEFEQNGVMQAEMDMNLLKKIEELTLYTIQQEKKIQNLKKENQEIKLLNIKLLELQSRLEKLESEK